MRYTAAVNLAKIAILFHKHKLLWQNKTLEKKSWMALFKKNQF